MTWAEQSEQPLLFLKLDFSKAYDMVEWGCLYKVLHKMGFLSKFIHMVSLLFIEAAATVKVNGIPSLQFKIGRQVRQGCLVALYMFLIISKVLNRMVAKELQQGRVKGIQLPFSGPQQTLAQSADDTSFTLLGVEESALQLVRTLNVFCLATGVILIWSKSNGYWKCSQQVDRLAWTENLDVTWADNSSVSKLLGAPFGLSPERCC